MIPARSKVLPFIVPLTLALSLSTCRDDDQQSDVARSLAISVLSSRPDMITGGDALVRIDSSGIDLSSIRVTLDNNDISASFQASPDGHSLQGLVENLSIGENTLQAMGGTGNTRSQTILVNHPLTGPVISGPHIQPFVCSTLAQGLGEALDTDCTAVTQVTYFYQSEAGQFRGIDDVTAAYPSDMVYTTVNGINVPFLVRVESGTINRSIYHLAVLDDPQRTYGAWDPTNSWNERLLFSFGGGCGTNYTQGARAKDSVLDAGVLASGFAHMVSSFNVMGHQCNDNLSAETLMMLKEHFIENYGLPVWTLGSGASGGAIQQLLISQNYPGLLNGLMPSMSFADSFSLRPGVSDCRLLQHYYDGKGDELSAEQKLAIEGFSAGTCSAWEHSYVDVIVADKGCGIVPELIYNAQSNPKGARCTIYDTNIASIGRDPASGFAYQALDNIGVQYGLQALEAGIIAIDEFIDLNTHIGGYDRDGKLVETRTQGQLKGIEAAYKTGRINQGSGGMAYVPILQFRPYLDADGDIHDRFRDFQIRARLRNANGNADNQVIWIYSGTEVGAQVSALALSTMTQWLDNLTFDQSEASITERILRAKPAQAVDGCWDNNGIRINEPLEFDASGVCNTLYPSHSNPRIASGAPLAEDTIKCALRTPMREDYAIPIDDVQWQQLLAAFPEGVCDYSQAGQSQVGIAGTFLTLPL